METTAAAVATESEMRAAFRNAERAGKPIPAQMALILEATTA